MVLLDTVPINWNFCSCADITSDITLYLCRLQTKSQQLNR